MVVTVTVAQVGRFEGQEVELAGWVYNRRSSGRIAFLLLRDGTGVIQCVITRDRAGEQGLETFASLTQESSCRVWGVVRADRRAPGGYELDVTRLEPVHVAEDYPIKLKEHGVDFLMDHRHLWIRTPRQNAVLRVRAAVMQAAAEVLAEEGFVRVDAPILTPSAPEGTTNLFETDYFGEKAYLSQSGQLYMEAACMALGKVYCLGPTFRAEQSKTRRHLLEFWMLEPEAAFFTHEDNVALQERLVRGIVLRVLDQCARELETLGRDPETLRREVEAPFVRISYDDALRILDRQGLGLPWGEDFGAPHETALSEHFGRPVFVERFPAQVKAFYMEPDPERPEVALCADLLAPEGYGEIIGGSQRISDLDLLLRRIDEHGLSRQALAWYIDLRRYGSVPHSGFGLGIERTVAWICGLEHVREAIPFPRLLNRLYP
ncbi:asparagine--tRNA ligase [Thermaerobacter subterraneus]|uniref:asparagine--tRNA ligase n=1 Tax=Thermaerobacter subterraneus TaxID=175696 RepID=UPI0005942886|nr:asparagine--tRNA ligase [Thermaerobacter subterraneus]